ncbi:MAG: FHA domain-containing protein [Planctomycetia bacterium]|nr:FHA domain-containing protein [Planctomycetia bacterium]
MDLKLRVLEGKNAGQEISVPGKKFFIGRAEDCHLRPGSDLISRHHCVLLIEEGYIGVRDFGSKNGTYVNQERVVGERELKAGDRLTVGPLLFEVHVAHELGGKKRPPVVDIKEAAARTAQDAAENPVDVTQWLAGAPDAESKTAAIDQTQPLSTSDTDANQLGSTQSVVPEAPEEKRKVPPGKRPVGKLPPLGNTSKDSQEAAAAMLSKFRKRR